MLDLRPVFFVCGVLLSLLAAIMLIPALVDIASGDKNWLAFVRAAGVTLFVGIALIIGNRRTGRFKLNLRQAFAFTSLSWLILVAFAALPFVFSRLGMNYTDAFFEAMSGITTTGSTVIIGLDEAPPGVLLWRAILQWLGGIGIIVFALAFLPMLRVGGMQLFRTEAFDTPEKVLPRAAQLAGYIGGVYSGFTILTAALLWLTGMSFFDAVCHAMTSISTAGFSTHDASIAAFDPATHWVLIGAMIAGSLPFVLYIDALRGHARPLWKDSQVRLFFILLFVAITVMFLYRLSTSEGPVISALREAAFNVTSIVTGTGYVTAGYDNWGAFAFVFFFVAMFIGGCAGSTTCSIKIFRFQVAFTIGKTQIRKLMQPHGVFIPYYNRRPIPDEVASSVMAFFLLFLISFTVLALALSLTGLDPHAALSGAATSITNVGPGLGELIGPQGTFTKLTDPAKWIMSAGMLVGRLEIFTVFILFAPSFWRS